MAEFDTWVPYVRQHVPRPVVLGGLVGGLALAWHYARDQLYDAAFYFAIILAGNMAMWRLERWTAECDRAAVRAGVPTRGWPACCDASWARRASWRAWTGGAVAKGSACWRAMATAHLWVSALLAPQTYREVMARVRPHRDFM